MQSHSIVYLRFGTPLILVLSGHQDWHNLLTGSRPDGRCIALAAVRRKVRAPQGGMPGNAWEAQAYGKCRRKYTARHPSPQEAGFGQG